MPSAIHARRTTVHVYAILTEWPGTQVVLKTVRPVTSSSIRLLGSDATLPWSFSADRGTTIQLPENLQQQSNRPCEYAWTLKIEAVRS